MIDVLIHHGPLFTKKSHKHSREEQSLRMKVPAERCRTLDYNEKDTSWEMEKAALAFHFPVLILCANLDCTYNSWFFVASALDLPTTALPLTATSVIAKDLRQRQETEKVATIDDNESQESGCR